MTRPTVLVVRETPSLADSLQLLLETVGYGVRTEVGIPTDPAGSDGAEEPDVSLIILACNTARSAVLRGYPEQFPISLRRLPLVVVGSRAADARGPWSPRVHFVDLPIDPQSFVQLVDQLAASRGSDTTEALPIAP